MRGNSGKLQISMTSATTLDCAQRLASQTSYYSGQEFRVGICQAMASLVENVS